MKPPEWCWIENQNSMRSGTVCEAITVCLNVKTNRKRSSSQLHKNRRHLASTLMVTLWNGCFFQVCGLYYPTERPSQRRGWVACRLRQESFPITWQSIAVWKQNKPLYEARIYRAVVRPVLTYACETWPLRVDDTNRIESFDHRRLNHMAKTKWFGCVSNAAVHQ